MKKQFFLLALFVFSLSAFAQSGADEEIKVLAETNQYQKIIDEYTLNIEDYSAESLFHIGVAYFLQEDLKNASKYVNYSIEKNPERASPYSFRANILAYQGDIEGAEADFQKAIDIEPAEASYYAELGNLYYSLNRTEESLAMFQKATEQESADDHILNHLAIIYNELGDIERSLEMFYKAKSRSDKDSELYRNILFNIGLIEVMVKKNYDAAEKIYTELVEAYPDDYQTYTKLIQIYNHLEQYKKVQPYKDVLYKAHAQGLLEETAMRDMFCIDQFEYNGIQIMAFERYQDGVSEDIYEKNIFYIIGDDGEIKYKIQTEFSPIGHAFGEADYVLCSWEDGTHSNYGIWFKDNPDYKLLKEAVIKILSKE